MRMQVQFLALLSGLRIQCCCELWYRLQTWFDPTLLWLWHMPADVALIQILAWEPQHAVGAALKKKTKNPSQKCIMDMESRLVVAKGEGEGVGGTGSLG